MREMTYIAAADDDGRPVRSVVPRRFHLGTHAFRRLKVQGGILRNGTPVHADALVRAGDVLTLLLPSDLQCAPTDAPREPLPAQLPPSFIRYADDDLLIVSKGAPLATLPCGHLRTGTLREQLCAMLGADPQTYSYHPVNRLDKGTSGLLCVARHAHAQRLLTAQLHTDAFVREYLAVTQGIPPERDGTIDAPIARLCASGAKRAVLPDGQRAVTHFYVEQTAGSRALVRLRLQTGRTHQIRVHLSHIGCPIVGDYLYGQPHPALPDRFALHSALLRCAQPVTGAGLEVCEPLPPALLSVLREG